MRYGCWLRVLLGSGLLAACEGDDREVQQSFCRRFCDRVIACDGDPSNGGCYQYCDEQLEASIVDRRLYDAMGPCAAGASCEAVLSGEYYGECYEEAAAKVEPGQRAIESCEEITRNDYECGLFADVGACVDFVKVLKTEMAERIVGCSREADCQEQQACYEELYQ